MGIFTRPKLIAPFQMDRIISRKFRVLGGEPVCGAGSWRKRNRTGGGRRMDGGGAISDRSSEPHGGSMWPRGLFLLKQVERLGDGVPDDGGDHGRGDGDGEFFGVEPQSDFRLDEGPEFED